MRINPISMASVYKNQNVGFKADSKKEKPLIEVTDDMPDDKVVSYGTWGGNYAYPITAGQIRRSQQIAQEQRLNASATDSNQSNDKYNESPEDYQRRKLYTTEWT